MSKVLGVRVDDDTVELVDQAAAEHGMVRSTWLAAVIDRGLVGAGRLTDDQARDRRAARAGTRAG